MNSPQTLSIKDQQNFQILMTEIKQLYKQLKSCSHAPIQNTIIWSLKPKCQNALNLIQKAGQKSQYVTKKKQINDIKARIAELQFKINQNQEKNPQIGSGGRIVKLETDKNYNEGDLQAQFGKNINLNLGQTSPKYSPKKIQKQQQITIIEPPTDSIISRDSMRVLRNIAIQQVQSMNLKYTDKELNEILTRLQNNQEVMQNIEGMLQQQGNNVDKVEENINKVYQDVLQVNQELTQAEKEQVKAVNKVRQAFQKSAMGFWGIVSWPFKKIFRKKKATQPQQSTPKQSGTSTPGQTPTP